MQLFLNLLKGLEDLSTTFFKIREYETIRFEEPLKINRDYQAPFLLPYTLSPLDYDDREILNTLSQYEQLKYKSFIERANSCLEWMQRYSRFLHSKVDEYIQIKYTLDNFYSRSENIDNEINDDFDDQEINDDDQEIYVNQLQSQITQLFYKINWTMTYMGKEQWKLNSLCDDCKIIIEPVNLPVVPTWLLDDDWVETIEQNTEPVGPCYYDFSSMRVYSKQTAMKFGYPIENFY